MHFSNQSVRILIQALLKFVSHGQINNAPALFKIMAWRRALTNEVTSMYELSNITDASRGHSYEQSIKWDWGIDEGLQYIHKFSVECNHPSKS